MIPLAYPTNGTLDKRLAHERAAVPRDAAQPPALGTRAPEGARPRWDAALRPDAKREKSPTSAEGASAEGRLRAPRAHGCVDGRPRAGGPGDPLGPGPRPVVGDLGRLVGREGREAVLRDPVLKSDYFSPPGTAVGILDQTLGYDRDGDPEGSRCGWSLARRRPRLLRVGAVRGQGLWDFGRVAGVPARRKVGTFRERLCIDPMDLSLLGGQAGVPAWHLSVTG